MIAANSIKLSNVILCTSSGNTPASTGTIGSRQKTNRVIATGIRYSNYAIGRQRSALQSYAKVVGSTV